MEGRDRRVLTGQDERRRRQQQCSTQNPVNERADNTGTQVKCAQKMDIVYKMLLVVFKEQQGKGG
jgi:hypothetical protein